MAKKINEFDKIILNNIDPLKNKYRYLFFKPWKFISYLKDKKTIKNKIYDELINNNIYSGTNIDYLVQEFCNTYKKFSKILPRKKRRHVYKEFIAPKFILDNLKLGKSGFNSQKNKLCYCINHSLPYRNDGYATRSKYMAECLANIFIITVITKNGFPWNEKKWENADIPKAEEQNGILYIHHKRLKKSPFIIKRYLDLAKEMEKVFIKEKPEYVIAASNYVNAMPALIAAKSLGIPFYYEVRGFWEVTAISRDKNLESTLWYLYSRYFETEICRLSDGVFTLTNAMKEELIARGVDGNKIYLTPNCADIDLFRPCAKDKNLMNKLGISETDVVIGYAGSIQMYEGLDDLIEACSILSKKGFKYKLLIVGGAPDNKYDNYLREKADSLGISTDLIMPGRVPVEEVSKYYSLIDIAPFGRKNLPVCDLVSPIKPLEAMAMQKTVIVSNLRALCEIVQNDITGLTFEKGNINSYAQVLERAIKDKDLRKKLGLNARKWIKENRRWAHNANIIKKVLEEA